MGEPRKLHGGPAAFTIVEILIVVVILAILAALVLPQFSNASDKARANATASTLKEVRSQLQVYEAEHDGQLPARKKLWQKLTLTTNKKGQLVANGKFGPYLKRRAVNPYTNSSKVAAPGKGGSDDGWEYDPNTGEFNAVGFNEKTRQYTGP